MKRILALSVCCLMSTFLAAQTTFSVCNVEKAETPLEEVSYREVMTDLTELTREPGEERWIRLEQGDTTASPEPRLEAFGQQPYGLVPTDGLNPFAMAVYYAYSEHRPLVLSPDMIWLLVVQGFAAHIDANAEELRDHFVLHDGRKVLCVRRDDYRRGDESFPWPEVFGSFEDQIAANTHAQLLEQVSATFSTSGATEKAAFQVTLMDAMSAYFMYAMQALCGIPEITLEGTPDDWAELERRTAALGGYELEWWTSRLQPILQEFTRACEGEVNEDFWRDMFQIESIPDGCTTVNSVTGWVVQFFPYLHGKPNPWVTETAAVDRFHAALKKDAWARPQEYGLPAIELINLPSGCSRADLLLDYHGQYFQYRLLAGFIGIRQDAETLALRPEINWLVVDANTKPEAADVALYETWLEKRRDVVGKE